MCESEGGRKTRGKGTQLRDARIAGLSLDVRFHSYQLQLKAAWEADMQECMHSWAPLTLGNSLAAAGTSLKSGSITETVLERK